MLSKKGEREKKREKEKVNFLLIRKGKKGGRKGRGRRKERKPGGLEWQNSCLPSSNQLPNQHMSILGGGGRGVERKGEGKGEGRE